MRELRVANITSDKADAPARETAGTRLAAKRAAKAARKAAKRGTSNPAEEMVKHVAEVNAWVDTHAPKLWMGVGVVVVAVAAAFAFSYYSEGRDRDAGGVLQKAVTTSEGIIVGPDETPPEDAIVPTFTSEKERDEKALKQYQDVDKQYPSSTAAHYALLGQGNELLALGKYPEAGAAFDKVIASDAKDTFVRFRALEGSGYALEAQKKYADARSRFEQLSKLNNGAYRTLGDYHRARMLVAEGQRDEARKLLEALNKAAADKPEEQGEAADRFESVNGAVQTLLAELGGQPVEKSNNGISQQVLDSLRKQMAAHPK